MSESTRFVSDDKVVHWERTLVRCAYDPVIEKMLTLYFTPGGAAPLDFRMQDPVYSAAFKRDRELYSVMRWTLKHANPPLLDAVDRAIDNEMAPPHEKFNADTSVVRQ